MKSADILLRKLRFPHFYTEKGIQKYFFQILCSGRVAQWSTHWSSDLKVPGSTPPWGKLFFSFFIILFIYCTFSYCCNYKKVYRPYYMHFVVLAFFPFWPYESWRVNFYFIKKKWLTDWLTDWLLKLIHQKISINTVESLFLGSKTFLLHLFFYPKSHHPHIQIELNINKSHPHVQEEDQDWRQNRKIND